MKYEIRSPANLLNKMPQTIEKNGNTAASYQSSFVLEKEITRRIEKPERAQYLAILFPAELLPFKRKGMPIKKKYNQ